MESNASSNYRLSTKYWAEALREINGRQLVAGAKPKDKVNPRNELGAEGLPNCAATETPQLFADGPGHVPFANTYTDKIASQAFDETSLVHRFTLARLEAIPGLSHISFIDYNVFTAIYNGEDCVVKVNKERKIQREYRRYSELQESPYVATMLDAYTIDNIRACLILRRYNPLPNAKSAAEVMLITNQLLTVLAELHGLGLAHGDIKNSNIMWDEEQQCIKLIDFETCVRVPPGAYFKTDCGTELFKSPELLHKGWCSPNVDVFAAGLVCASLLSQMYGCQIWCEEVRDAVLEAVRRSLERPGSPTFCKPLLPLFQRMLAADPMQRISAADAVKMMRAVMESTTPVAYPQSADTVDSTLPGAHKTGSSGRVVSQSVADPNDKENAGQNQS